MFREIDIRKLSELLLKLGGQLPLCQLDSNGPAYFWSKSSPSEIEAIFKLVIELSARAQLQTTVITLKRLWNKPLIFKIRVSGAM